MLKYEQNKEKGRKQIVEMSLVTFLFLIIFGLNLATFTVLIDWLTCSYAIKKIIS